MFTSDGIVGIEKLRAEIPKDLQAWYKFGKIVDLHFFFDIDDFGQDIRCLDIILTDSENRYRINLHLKNVCGKVSFEPYNGFYSGLAIEDLIDNGYERTNRFHFYSYEMDNDTNVYCEKIIAELVQE